MTFRNKLKLTAAWIARRASEPTTYAGIAAGALAVAEIARDAQSVADVFKNQGATAGVLAAMAAVVAIAKSEDKKPDAD